MKILNDNDFKILKKLVSFNQEETKEFVAEFLDKYYPDVIESEEYILAEGNIPIALVAHMDTVFDDDDIERDFLFRYANGKMYHPDGAGFDDKAGILSIFKILEDGYLPHVIFTTNEEIGSLGAKKLVEDMPECPFNDLKYVIELDRANEYDCVFYLCENEEFISYVESFGFVKAFGSFTDIRHICPAWNVAGTNLSIGYKDEHTKNETLNINAMFDTISKVKKMLDDCSNVDGAFVFDY
jgi:di/tripeptidase